MTAKLILEDGTIFTGKAFGAEGTAYGEAVFNTSMLGYPDILTDPENTGKIVCMTYPLIGNYGVMDAYGKISRLSGFVVREKCEYVSNYRPYDHIEDFMRERGIIGLYDIDTRALTIKLRDSGAMKAAITTEDSPAEKHLADLKTYTVNESLQLDIDVSAHVDAVKNRRGTAAVYCFGAYKLMAKCLNERGYKVSVFNGRTKAADILAGKFDLVVISDGAGDPRMASGDVMDTIKALCDSGTPLLGISLGHQLIALSMGGVVEKLKNGHRGSNYPVLDKARGRTYMSAQNHGYVVKYNKDLSEKADISHVNINDDSVEGLVYRGRPIHTVQFLPDTAPGVSETEYVFDEILKKVR